MIGVDDNAQALGSSPSDYKRDILFYDQLLLMHSNVAIGQWRHGSLQKAKYRQFADEMEHLLETPYFLPADALAGVPVQGEGVAALGRAVQEVDDRMRAALPEDSGLRVGIEEFLRLQALRASLHTRLAAESLTNFGQPAVSVHVVPKFAEGAATPALQTGDVVRLAIDRVSIPDERTSWEDIFALKADRELQERARKLRLWALDTAHSEDSLALADERLSDLLADYERYLKAHRLKYSYTSIGAVVTSAAGMLEDMLKLRLGKLAGRFFSAAKTKADMTLSELSAPGRELSLVTHINERLV